MAEETIIEQKQEEQVQPQVTDIWGNAPVIEEKKEEVVEQKVEEVKPEEVVQEAQEEIVEPNVWLEREFGWKDAQTAKAEIKELRKLKEAKPQEFANEESKRLYEALLAGKEDDIYAVLEQKKKFQKAESLNVEDAKQATQLLQLSYQLKYKDLSPIEITDLFEEQYQKPEKPEQSLDQTDQEYQETLQKWQARCDAIDRKIVRDAKIARPDLLKLKSEIVFPEIPKAKEEVQTAKQPTQEELQAAEKFKNEFLQAANKSVNELKGFTAQVKNKDVDFTVSYVPSVEEKTAVEATLKSFAEVGFNANHLFAQRWVNEDGSVNATKMAADLAFLDNKEKVLQKVATDAAHQRLELYLKGKKQVNIKDVQEPSQMQVGNDGKTEHQQLQEAVWG